MGIGQPVRSAELFLIPCAPGFCHGSQHMNMCLERGQDGHGRLAGRIADHLRGGRMMGERHVFQRVGTQQSAGMEIAPRPGGGHFMLEADNTGNEQLAGSLCPHRVAAFRNEPGRQLPRVLLGDAIG